jgi:hypothetical protein
VVGAAQLLVAGCIFPKAGALPEPATPDAVARAQAKWSDASDSSLAAGRQLFASHCNACHSYPDLNAISEDRWPAIVEKMGRKAGLEGSEEQLLLRFVLTARAGGPKLSQLGEPTWGRERSHPPIHSRHSRRVALARVGGTNPGIIAPPTPLAQGGFATRSARGRGGPKPAKRATSPDQDDDSAVAGI